MELQPGDIVVFKGKTIFSKFVRLFRKSEYTHCAMMVSDKKMIEANWYKKVNIVDFKYKPEIMEIYRYKGGLNVSQQISIVQSSYEMLDKYYDYPQILGFLLESIFGDSYKNPFNFNDFIICSELIDKAYLKNEIDLVESKSDGNVAPDDLPKSTKIERIY